jgi:putative iron-regulated protein
VTEGDGAAPNAERRGTYLSVVTDLLLEQLQEVTAAWKAGDAGNFRDELESGDPDQSLAKILTGMFVLSGFETGGERLQTALTSGEQNDEHSCFSDNTHRDMVQDVQGVLNVWQGSYTTVAGKKVAGPGIGALVKANNPELFAKLDKQIKGSLTKAEALKPPFDNEIAQDNTAGRDRVDALIQSLHTQEKLIGDAAEALGVEVTPAE